MARSRPVARIAARLPAPRLDPLQGVRRFVRTSPWLAIAIAAHVIVGAAFAVVQLTSAEDQVVDDTVIFAGITARSVPDELVLPPEDDILRREIPENRAAELIPPDAPQLPPALVQEDVDYKLDFGDPDADPGESDFPDGPPGAPGGTNIGVGTVGQRGIAVSGVATPRIGTGVPGGTGKGTPFGRTQGPTQVIDAAILDGLRWLARHQDETGRWSGSTCSRTCQALDPDALCQPETALEAGLYSTQADVGLTSLALLTFLGAGYSPDAEQILVDQRAGRPYVIGKDIVRPGLKWLVEQQRPDGSFSDGGAYFLYNEALATLALCEAYGLTRRPYWKKPAQRALEFICRAQKPSPLDPSRLWGWRYQPASLARDGGAGSSVLSEADISVTGWMVMALKSGQLAGLSVPQASIDGALDFTRWSTAGGGLVGYLGPETAGDPIVGDHDEFAYHPGTMSSIGMCVRIFLEQDRADPFLEQGAEVLLADLPALGSAETPQVDYYYWYYGSLALNQFDGPDSPRRTNRFWGPWNRAMNDTILALQDKSKEACSFGGWMAPDRWAYGFGPVYTTAISVLTLEVYYRYENAFGMKRAARAPQPAGAAASPAPAESDESR